MPKKFDSNKVKAELSRLAEEVVYLRAASAGKVMPLPMLSMAAVLTEYEKEETASATSVFELLSKALDRKDYGEYINAWKDLFSLTVQAEDAACRLRYIQPETIADAVCRGFERGVMSFTRYPTVSRNIRPLVQSWQVYNACLAFLELPTIPSDGHPKSEMLHGKHIPVAGTAELQAVWSMLDTYSRRRPEKGKRLRSMALSWRGGTLAEIVLGFRITRDEIAKHLSELHCDLRKSEAYSLKGLESVGNDEALALLRLISQAYRFLPGKPGHECPDNVELCILAAGLSEGSIAKHIEAHMLECRVCAQKIIGMGDVTKAVVKLSASWEKPIDLLWNRIEAFVNLWNGKRVVLQLDRLTLTIDATPKMDGVNIMLRSKNKQPFSVEIGGNRVLKAIEGEVEIPVSVPTTVRVKGEAMVAASLDLPAYILEK